MQHGADAYCEMLANIKKIGSKYVGNISNKTIVIDYKGYKIGFVVFSQRGDQFSEKPLYWLRPEYEEIEIESNKMQDCDFKIVYIHWGNEFMDYPNIEQKKFAHWLIDIGFDLVVGSHPHVLQGYEVYKEKFIFYSLGNFLFNMPAEATRYSAIVNVDVEMGKLKVCYDYVFIDKENRPKIIEIQYVPKKYLFSTLNNKISFEGDNEDYYKEMFRQLSIYRKKNHYWMLTTFLKHSPKELFFTYSNYLLRQLKR
jgi:hypothetical protein